MRVSGAMQMIAVMMSSKMDKKMMERSKRDKEMMTRSNRDKKVMMRSKRDRVTWKFRRRRID